MRRWVPYLAGFAVGGLCLSIAAAPRPAETPAEKREKAVREFVAKSITALGKHDFDSFVGLCDVPFLVQPSSPVRSGVWPSRDGLRERLERGYEGKPTFDGTKHVVQSIRTLNEAKDRLGREQAADAAAVLTGEGLVVQVQIPDCPKPSQVRLLIRTTDGQFRVAGIQAAGEDE